MHLCTVWITSNFITEHGLHKEYLFTNSWGQSLLKCTIMLAFYIIITAKYRWKIASYGTLQSDCFPHEPLYNTLNLISLWEWTCNHKTQNTSSGVARTFGARGQRTFEALVPPFSFLFLPFLLFLCVFRGPFSSWAPGHCPPMPPNRYATEHVSSIHAFRWRLFYSPWSFCEQKNSLCLLMLLNITQAAMLRPFFKWDKVYTVCWTSFYLPIVYDFMSNWINLQRSEE